MMDWDYSWTDEQIEKLNDLTRNSLICIEKSIDDKSTDISTLSWMFESSEPKTTKFDSIINFLLDFVLESDEDTKLKEDILYAIESAVIFQDTSNIDFFRLASRLSELPGDLIRASIELMSCTENLEYLSYIMLYKNHEQENVRVWVDIADKKLKGKKEDAEKIFNEFTKSYLGGQIFEEDFKSLKFLNFFKK